VTGQTHARQNARHFDFRGHGDARFSSFDRDVGGRRVEFAGCSPTCGRYEFGRSHSIESQMSHGPCSSFLWFSYSSNETGVLSHGGSSFGRHVRMDLRFDDRDRMDSSFCRDDRMDRANPTLEQMAQHWFYSFATNPVLSRLLILVLAFEFQAGGLGNVCLIDSDGSRHMTGDGGWFSSLTPVVSKVYITFGDNG
jgi:hypothetical protein